MNLFQLKIKNLLPAYFALVMATGAISLAAFLGGMPLLAKVIFYLTLVFFAVLGFFFIYRCIYFKNRVLEDFKSYQRGPGFFTIVAALCIVGNQLIFLFDAVAIAEIVLLFSAGIWLLLIYGFFFNITVTKSKKSINNGISGSWLLIIVSIQALSILISLVADDFGNRSYLFVFLALCLFLLGCIFYLYMMSLIIYRMSFFSLHASELGAPYWINMGATAISTLAGATLIMHTGKFHFIVDIMPFLKGFTLFFWAAGTWWIPLLVILGIWRHLIQKELVPITAKGYNPTYWSIVFPLAMYTMCTFRLSEVLEIGFLKVLPQFFFYAAIFAWLVVFIGFISHYFQLFTNKIQPETIKNIDKKNQQE